MDEYLGFYLYAKAIFRQLQCISKEHFKRLLT
jgi:hypothetical protein